MKLILRLGLSLLPFVLTQSAIAGLIEYSYTGTVLSRQAVVTGQFSRFEGASVSGTFGFDDSLEAVLPDRTNNNLFSNDTEANSSVRGVWYLTINVVDSNGVVPDFNDRIEIDSGDDRAWIELIDDPTLDSFQFVMWDYIFPQGPLRNSSESTRGYLQMADLPEIGIEPDAVLPGSNGLTGGISDAISILDSLDPASFSENGGANFSSFWEVYPDETASATTPPDRFEFSISSITRQVPTPTTLTLMGLGLAGLGLRRCKS